ncbi:MAG: hypothetical protein IJY20_00250 [Clostridia bacterium]|nr:hypothetical protein [Clostridia bacterium]
MKHIGLIDYYISEWHANNYPAWITRLNADLGTDFTVSYAWAEREISPVDGVDTATWCEKNGITQCASIAEVCEKSDALIILAPSDPDTHLRYAQAVLPYGKPTYIDKTFAPDTATAEEIMRLSAQYHTPFFSTSALRYADALKEFSAPKQLMISGGGSNLPEYVIHLVEMVICLQPEAAKTVTVVRQGNQRICHIDHEGGAKTTLLYSPALGYAITGEDASSNAKHATVGGGFFDGLMADILRFFTDCSKTPVPNEQTLAVMRLRDAILAADQTPGSTVNV